MDTVTLPVLPSPAPPTEPSAQLAFVDTIAPTPKKAPKRKRKALEALPGKPDLTTYDWIVVSSSGGKDSQAMLDVVVYAAKAAGVLNRVVVVHCDLGRVEWEGTRELAEEQARHYGLRFEVVSRPQGDLLEHVEQHGKWPGPDTRYCTSDHKRAQTFRVLTRLVAEKLPLGKRTDKPIRILDCQGLRAEESPEREKMVPYFARREASNLRRQVDTWLPIHHWTTEDVWERIRASGVRYHRAYDLGMPRLSCVFCLAGETEVVTRQGIRPIRDLAGQRHPLLVPKETPFGLSGHGHFVDVEVRSFGVQPLLRVGLRRAKQTKVVYATAEHRWLTIEEKPRTRKDDGRRDGYEDTTVERVTAALQPGMRLRGLQAHPLGEAIRVPFAVAQGFVYGDGSRGDDERPATLAIYDKSGKDNILAFFAGHELQRQEAAERTTIYGLPRFWKDLPPIEESRSFLLSWLAGYFAADGCVSEVGQVKLSSANQEALRFARSVAAICGIRHGTLSSVERVGYGTEASTLYGLTLDARDLPGWFFIKELHQQRIGDRAASRSNKDLPWVVESVETTDRVEEVFCAVVPGVHAFGLADGLMTGNCIYSTQDALLLAAHHNQALLAEYVRVEQKIGHSFQINGKKHLPIADVQARMLRGEMPKGRVASWCM
jgi:3'-phosphoadenosine 5'-phosphosulfate sulfotransferase (PAPS reductase)/FAD synthetase